MSVSISPVLNLPYIQDPEGNPLNGGKIFAYEGGSFSVLQETFTSSAGDVANANPIELTASGSLPPGVMIWLTNGLTYNFLLTEADGVTALRTFENVIGVGSSSSGGGGSGAIWVEAPGATFLSGNSFLVEGNLAAEFGVGNRVRVTLSGGVTYGVVSAVSFSFPSTFVTIVNDGPVLDSSVSLAEYSILVASPGETVDAGGVSFFDAMPYTTANTVGWKLKQTETALGITNTNLASTEAQRARDELVFATSGSYTITPTPAITSYAIDQKWTVRFTTAGGTTFDVNGVGSKNLYQYSNTGGLVTPIITAGMLSDVGYDATNDCFILLDALPPGASEATVTPRGQQYFTSNGTFTVPAGVFFLEVTCVGGGGGGGNGTTIDGESGTIYYVGRGGGGGAVGKSVITTTPGTSYTVSIGAGGVGGNSGTLAPGGTGGTTAFGVTLCTAAGGAGAANYIPMSPFYPALGGSTGNDLVIPGANGGLQVGGGTPGWSLGGGVGRGSGGLGSAGGSPNNGVAGNAGCVWVQW